jgi:asparagine synthase (glutamine-hydrolysing)
MRFAAQDRDPHEKELRAYQQAGGSSLDRMSRADLQTYLVRLLMKQDQMSMAASIESRVPFLDHHLVEFAAALPPRMKLRGLTTKWILRESVKAILPREILTRKKMGFPVPFSHWLRGAGAGIARDVLLDSQARHRGITDPVAVSALIDAHATGAADAGDALWSLLNLELWYRTFIDGEGIQTLHSPSSLAQRQSGELRAIA